jgi:hypothetical protein
MITFIEHEQTGYAMRTWDNVRLSDLTVAIANDFSSAGEILTRKAAYGKYLGIEFDLLLTDINKAASIVLKEMEKRKVRVLNVAGNGIYSLKHLCDQAFVDDRLLLLFTIIILNYGNDFDIRSGGQSGIDEASIKAGDFLNMPTTCLAPKNWMFRNIEGRDICSESLFLKRFGPQYDITDIL